MSIDKNEFLERIYKNIKVGMEVVKPRKKSKIIEIRPDGNIYYLIGTANSKAVTKSELSAVYDKLEKGGITTQDMCQIVTDSKPCNVTTIKWLLKKLNLAYEDSDKNWRKKW